MGKRYNNTASAFGIAQVEHVPVRRKDILERKYVSNQNDNIIIEKDIAEYFRHLPSIYKAINWDKMSKKKKILFVTGVAAAAIGIVGGVEYGLYKGEHVKSVKEKLFSKSAIKTVGGGIIVAEKAANESAAATPQVSETPYSYDARAGNPDPSIPFINGSGDKEWEDVVNWHMEQFKKFSPYDVDEFQKYLVFRQGKNPKGYIDYTKDRRRIFYIDDYEWTSKKSLVESKNKNISAWSFFRTTAHFIGHDKFNKKDECNDSKCIEMPAIEYGTDAMIRVGIFRPEDREKMINSEWEAWKKQHNYTEK